MALGEVAYFDEQDASNAAGIYGTVGGSYAWSQWTGSLSYFLREQENGLPADQLIQTSVGYEFDFSLGVEVGYRFGDEAKVKSHTLGTLLTYGLSF
jgi:opacity protein-like surface antigen